MDRPPRPQLTRSRGYRLAAHETWIQGQRHETMTMPKQLGVPMTATDETDWRARAACASADPDLFFPISSRGPSYKQERRAKAFCAVCCVRAECLNFALKTGQVHGVWGGLGEEERARLRRRRRVSAGGPSGERIPGTDRAPRRGARQQHARRYPGAA